MVANITPIETVQPEIAPVPSKATLYAKLARVMGKVNRVPKAGFNDHFKYKFATDADVSDLIRTALAEEGVAFFADMMSVKQEPFITVSDWQGKRQEKQSIKTKVLFEFTFACGDTGATKTCEWESEAIDQQDKGINKAATAAVKYFLLKTFLISTGETADDPDADDSEGKQPKKNERRIDTSKNAPQNGKEAPVTPKTDKSIPWSETEALEWVARQIANGHTDTELRTALVVNRWGEWDGSRADADAALAKFVQAEMDAAKAERATE